MKNNNNLVDLLYAHEYFKIQANNYYLTFQNNVNDFVYVFLLSDNDNYTLVNGFNYSFYLTQQDIVKHINSSLFYSQEQIDNIEDTNNRNLYNLDPLSKEDFLKCLSKTTGNSETINSYFVKHSELNKELDNLIILDSSLCQDGRSMIIFNENNYKHVLNKSNFYKWIEGDNNDSLFITSNPYMFSIYNQNGDKKSMLFNSLIDVQLLFRYISSKNKNKIEELEIGYLHNINDLIFCLKAVVGYYNVVFEDIFSLFITHNKIIISFQFNLDDLKKYGDKLVLFSGLLMPLNKHTKDLIQEESEHIKFSSDSYKINQLSIKQITFPNKLELIEIFISLFKSTFKLNKITLHKDYSFEDEEETNGMFEVITD